MNKTKTSKENPIFDKYVKKWISRKFLGVIMASFYFSIGLLGQDNWVFILTIWLVVEGTIKTTTVIGEIISEYLKKRK